MSVTAVVGAQWGDEGKGKIVDILSAGMNYVVRYQGGANAGHTINLQNRQYILHLVPSGILHPQSVCVIGNGVVIDPQALMNEIRFLEEKGIGIKGRLYISDRAHILFPFHKHLDQLNESRGEAYRIGTTGRGIGPAYVDKYNRSGIRIIELVNKDEYLKKIHARLEEVNALLEKIYDQPPLKIAESEKQYLKYREFILPFITDTSVMINRAIENEKRILLEGAQGTLLDVDHGTYPYVTSSSPVSGGASTGAGIGPNRIDEIIGVVKAYTTRVGEGPFPTELNDDAGEYFRSVGKEFGATTGRPRRCGWFDCVITRYAARINGLTSLAVTKMDVLDELTEIKICTGYKYRGEVIREFPADNAILQNCEPVYESIPGWKTNLKKIKDYNSLPENAKNYIDRIEQESAVPVSMVSVGAKRSETIVME
jgi:adenylosuccinate synthase